MCLGNLNFKIEKDPIKLWSADSSRARQNKKYFDDNFNPFYRITHLIIEPKQQQQQPPPLQSQQQEQQQTPSAAAANLLNYTSHYEYRSSSQPNVTHNVTALQTHVLLEIYELYARISRTVAECVECAPSPKEHIGDTSGSHHPADNGNGNGNGNDHRQMQHPQVSLQDICFKPLQPDNNNCATQSLFQYWQNNDTRIRSALHDANTPNSKSAENEMLAHLDKCMRNPYTADCLSAFGAPIHPYMIVGSYKDEAYLSAGAVVVTFVINNYAKKKPGSGLTSSSSLSTAESVAGSSAVDGGSASGASNSGDNENEDNLRAMAWEAAVLTLLESYSSPLINVYYTTERSIEDELERESKADIKIIVISYAVMFMYLTITLGKYSTMRAKVVLIEMKIYLGLAGVSLVLLSVVSSGGLFTYLGVPATLITLEVIPFLLLAVGVDNIYVMVQTYQNDERQAGESVDDQIARIVGKVGPSMLLTGTTQSIAFLISALTPMPGVRAFSLYASLAIVLNFFMQITCFVVLLTLDAKRERAHRVDLLCCIKLNLDDDNNNRHNAAQDEGKG